MIWPFCKWRMGEVEVGWGGVGEIRLGKPTIARVMLVTVSIEK